jgi:hypothetical protein
VAKVKPAVMTEVRRFAAERDAQFEHARERAATKFKQQFDIDAILQNPEGYLRLLFTKAGLEVVKEMVDTAKKAGKDHAERLQQT